MADNDPKVTAFSAKALAFAWLGMALFGAVNFVVLINVGVRDTATGLLYVLAMIIIASASYIFFKWRAFAAGLVIGFSVMTLASGGTCTISTGGGMATLNNAITGAMIYSLALVVLGVLTIIQVYRE